MKKIAMSGLFACMTIAIMARERCSALRLLHPTAPYGLAGKWALALLAVSGGGILSAPAAAIPLSPLDALPPIAIYNQPPDKPYTVPKNATDVVVNLRYQSTTNPFDVFMTTADLNFDKTVIPGLTTSLQMIDYQALQKAGYKILFGYIELWTPAPGVTLNPMGIASGPPVVSLVPLPSALPLFAAAVGFLSFLTGRRPRPERRLVYRRLGCGPRADINHSTNRHRTAETFGRMLSWLIETVRLRSAPELVAGACAEN